jgi:hypothetical protein
MRTVGNKGAEGGVKNAIGKDANRNTAKVVEKDKESLNDEETVKILE